ncbi:PTS beta-glucoside transporter subunit IIBCA [Lactobacillus mulieris]|uniref:Glucose PTS transporter subunit IIA n=1 Tax=Lactobacillus mulieris TaxID=2508708 RepID=A0ABT4K0Y1_9LACO|nr:PTS beta-glucoside transporter subunit IIBCA [Lactobacillus mulieris]MCZ3621700.1 glucose PTS transporter subunit IIA [Lactobacillus mulieris]MCZ3623024.1 glucose PTS transporter subunit IIA [Lactobacillus mulieris]MCZ3635707.1 glucose PTS transporter subunit IIA [Lactobacillus mulieris]MCZ3690106.1 glucose PTS transporter subunit IIA [Lactobacillus mulieris]MCZ3696044.1 glucose PTS transporter subunit IIA [Lactobacillus mulieris]
MSKQTVNYKKLANEIIDIIGDNNIESVTHCETRLRFIVKNRNKIDDNSIQNLSGVKGVFFGSGQYQVIVGTGVVNHVYEEIEKSKRVNAIYGNDNVQSTEDRSNQPLGRRIMAMLAGIFIPIVPVIAATGLFLGLKSTFTNAEVLKLFGTTPSAIPSSLITVTSVLTDTVFAFLPALLVWSTFKYFKGTPIIGIVLGIMLVSPILPNAYSVANGSAKAIMLFNSIPVIGSQGSVLTALVAGFIGAKLELFFRKHMPNVLEQILTPFLTLLVTFAIMILGVGPIVHSIENILVSLVQSLIHLPFGIGGFLIGALYPLMVVVGIHQMMIAIETSLLAATHLNPLITLEAMYGFANLGVALAIFLRAKSQNAKENCASAMASQLFGVSEPTIFGVLIRYNMRPLFVTVFTSGLGAAVLGMFNVAANTYGLAVLPSYLMYIYNFRYLVIYTIVSVLTIVVAFILTNMFAIPKDVLMDDSIASAESKKVEVKDEVIAAPVSGETINLKEVSDPVFSSEMMGKGIAFKTPKSGSINVYAPASGKLSVVAKTGHAYGIKTEHGAEILVHLGLNTVSLNGEGFNVKVKEGESVKKGQLLGSMDVDLIRSKKLDPTIIMVVTNTDDYTKVESNNKNKVEQGEEILSVQKKKIIS